MFAKRLKLKLRTEGGAAPVPKAWLDQFFMRDFSGSGAFDETLPAQDGVLETGFGVDVQEVRSQFEKWLRGRKMIAPATQLTVE